MLTKWAQHWKALALRGLIAVVFGIVALFWPKLTVALLLLFFGMYVAIDGIIAMLASLRLRKTRGDWWLQLLQGVVGLIIGGFAIFWPTHTAQVLLYSIAAWALIVGVLQIILAFLLRKEIHNEWSLGLGGVLSVVLGIFFLALPTTIMVLLSLVGGFAILFGALLMIFAFRLRDIKRVHEQRVATPGT